MMRSVLAVVLFLGALFFWWAGGRERELAAAQRALLTLQFDEAARRFAALADKGLLDRLFGRAWPRSGTVATGQAAARYWSMPSATGSGDRTTERPNERATDAFLAANAAYRGVTAAGGDWRSVVARLDAIIEQYAEILRHDAGHRDGAFNYEFVVRYRAAVVARQRDVPPAGPDEPLPTIHGMEGSPPPGSGMKQFRMLVPMQPDERREAEEAGRAGRRVRKG